MSEAASVVRKMFDNILAGDLAGVMALIHPEVTVIEPESLAYGGVRHGAIAFQNEVLGAILGKFGMAVSGLQVLGTGDTVAANMQINFTSHKTGRSLAMPYVEVYSVEAGRIRKIDVYPQDTKRLVEFWDAS